MRTAAFLALLLAATASPRAGDPVHVAPHGDDAGPGTAARPFRTLERARDALRKAPDGERRIVVHPGDYMDVALTLDGRDAGLVIEGAPEEEPPTLYGSVPLGGWEPEEDGLWSSALPAGRFSPDASVRWLIVDGRPCPRARLPESGWYEHRSEFSVRWKSSTEGGWERAPTAEELTTVRVRPEELPAGLSVQDAEITLSHMWDESCVRLASFDRAEGILKLAAPAGHPPGAFGVRRYAVWNVREGLTRPGQWYHDRGRGRIVYRPRAGQDRRTAVALVPVARSVILARGTPKAPVQGLVLRRLRISGTDASAGPGGFAAARYDGAVQLENARDCALENLDVTRVGGHGIKAVGLAERLRIEGCEIAQCGAGGIYVGGTDCVLSANHVHRVGMSFPAAIGIYGGGRGSRVVRNEVHDCPYTAINYGGEENVIASNYIYDCMKTLHDGAAIYLFAARRCVVRGNIARDVADTGGYGASAFYLDERSEGCVIEGNLAWDVKRPVHNHMARDSVLRNNVFVVRGNARLTFPRSSGFVLERNIIYAYGAVRFENIDAVARWSGNLVYSGAGRIEGVPMTGYVPGSPEPGVRGDTLAADPRFRDLERMDLNFHADSPALTRGIEPLDLGAAGRPRPALPPPDGAPDSDR